ncbi:hypothetical protein [Acidovorax facilis]|uniref:hypothetical protein n=1 Tax=Acidovorax facilis TaxID=12917 RepID=UPI003D656617
MEVVKSIAIALAVYVVVSVSVYFGYTRMNQDHAAPELKIATIDIRKVSDEIFKSGGIGSAGISDAAQLSDRIQRASKSLADQGYLVVNKPLILAAPETLEVFDATGDVVKAVLGDR